MPHSAAIALFSLAVLLAARPAAPQDPPLAGTSWRLVEFQSMDDSIGVIRPEDPSAFTMRLGEDGTVSFRLDCNRATGTYSSAAGDDGVSGSFNLGPLAMTRALCPPPNLDERIARDAEYVRSFLLKDGHLYLSLMADGGIYQWEPEPDTVRFSSEPDPRIESTILASEPDYTSEMVAIDGRKGRYVYSKLDLDGDGRDEVFVYLLGSIFCGSGGCNLLLLSETEDGYALVSRFPISRVPVFVSTQTTRGWRDLHRRESGGGASPSYVRHAYDGERYVERERTAGDEPPNGTEVLAGDVTFDAAIPLEPVR